MDQLVIVSDRDSFLTARRVTREEGILVGSSTSTTNSTEATTSVSSSYEGRSSNKERSRGWNSQRYRGGEGIAMALTRAMASLKYATTPSRNGLVVMSFGPEVPRPDCSSERQSLHYDWGWWQTLIIRTATAIFRAYR